MRLKEIVLQKFQNSNNNSKNMNSNNNNNRSVSFVNICEEKQITDFSIKRILSDSNTNKDFVKNKQIQSTIQFNEVLDLSKTTILEQLQQQQQQQNQYFIDNNNIQKYLMFQNNYVNEHYLTITSSSKRITCNSLWSINNNESVVKPKVYKSWEQNCFNNKCNDCEMYFKSFHFGQNLIGKRTATTTTTASLTGTVNVALPLLPSIASTKTIATSDNNNCATNDPWSDLIQRKTFNDNIIAGNFISNSINNTNTVNLNISNNRKDDDEISHKCQFCDKVFGCAATLQSHEKTHKSPRYECFDCGKGFSQLRNYKYHLSVHRGTKEFAAECPECGKTFNDKGYLSSHMKIHRNKKEYECPYCPKSFNQRVAFNMHVRIHTGVKPHKCAECGKRFSRKMLLKQHMRTHSGEKPYQCTVCGKSFADRSNMTLHHRLHSGIKPFTCPICPKAFTKKHHLKTHLNYHTGCKPYVCPHPNCNQAFTQSSNMRTHSKKCQFRPLDVEKI